MERFYCADSIDTVRSTVIQETQLVLAPLAFLKCLLHTRAFDRVTRSIRMIALDRQNLVPAFHDGFSLA